MISSVSPRRGLSLLYLHISREQSGGTYACISLDSTRVLTAHAPGAQRWAVGAALSPLQRCAVGDRLALRLEHTQTCCSPVDLPCCMQPFLT